jgi:hypothetical protein
MTATNEKIRTYNYSGQIEYLDSAVQNEISRFESLLDEMRSFQPLNAVEMRAKLESGHQGMKALNSEANWKNFIDSQLKSCIRPGFQFKMNFYKKFGSEAITAIILSAALSEAVINASLSIGLYVTNRYDLFEMLEKNDLKLKWLVGPKLLVPGYKIPKSGKLYEQLQFTVKMRNAFLHHKLTIDSEQSNFRAKGSPNFGVAMNEDGYGTILDTLKLPYALHTNLLDQMSDSSLQRAIGHVLQKNH